MKIPFFADRSPTSGGAGNNRKLTLGRKNVQIVRFYKEVGNYRIVYKTKLILHAGR